MSLENLMQWRKNNPLKVKERKRTYKLRNQQFLSEYKKQHPCKCGESTICCLQFHHKDPSKKDGAISKKVKTWSIARLQEEIDKCVVMCANCHLKLHERLRKRKKILARGR